MRLTTLTICDIYKAMENKGFKEALTSTPARIVAIAAFVVVLILGMWGSVTLANKVPGVFSAVASAIVSLTSVFVPADEDIIISVPSLTVASGETFDISWEHANQSVEGSYTFRYDCADGVSFTSPSQSGSQASVFCNTPFNFLNAGDTITLTASSEQNRFIDVTLYVDFTPNGGSVPTLTGSTLLTIANEDISGSPTTTTPENETGTEGTGSTGSETPRTPGTETSQTFPLGGTPGSSDPNGYVDLAARVIEVGLVNKTNGEFTASSTPTRNMSTHRVAMRFAVENLGTKTSDQWTFNAVLPTFPSHIFSAPTQQALRPGDRIEFTIGFDSFVDADEGEVTINVDPTNRINESNKANNIVKYTVKTVK